VGCTTRIGTGRSVRAAFTNRDRATVELLDGQSERGALWTAAAAFPLDVKVFEAPRKHVVLKLRRRWAA